MKKIRICIIFGGRSGEHEVSLVSAESVIQSLNTDQVEPVLVGITKTGRWVTGPNVLEALKAGHEEGCSPAHLSHDPSHRSLIVNWGVGSIESIPIDVAFPLIHGPNGEDGTLQGLLELCGLPYVGANVASSAICMDKVFQKRLCAQAGLSNVSYLWTEPLKPPHHHKDPNFISQETIVKSVEQQLGFPVFVKPCRLGSSVGITQASDIPSLLESIQTAKQFDDKILIEKAIRNPREIEVSVLGNSDPKISLPGEILTKTDTFYDYNAKYVNDSSTLQIPADLPGETVKQIQQIALDAYLTCGCEGMARVDFLVERDLSHIYLNEINTVPGFTHTISMYPKMWEKSGLSFPKLIDQLIALALERHRRMNQSTLRNYTPDTKWYT